MGNVEQNDSGFISESEFRIGFDNEKDPKAMIINLPIQWCVDNPEIGTALIRGKLDEAKQIALNHVHNKRLRKAHAAGILKPNGVQLDVMQ